MADTPSDPAQDQEVKPLPLTPGDIANLKEAAAGAKAHLLGAGVDIDNSQSGQLSPGHTPGRRR